MSVETAKHYFELMDSADATMDDILEMFADDAVIHSPRKGIIRGIDEIRRFNEENAEFFTSGNHDMQQFHQDGNTVICEGYMNSTTKSGREANGVPLCDIFDFNENGKIQQFRAYLDYEGYLAEVPDEVPNVREQAEEHN